MADASGRRCSGSCSTRKRLARAPWLIPFGVNYVGPVIYTYGSDDQKRRLLPAIHDASVWWAQGYSAGFISRAGSFQPGRTKWQV
jgi:alkylation response protein AidB-like acyl-CoA dehydrogenase